MSNVDMLHIQQFDEMRSDFVNKTVPSWLDALSKFISTNDWFTGSDITVADFVLYERLAVLYKLCSNCFDTVDNLKAFLKRFEALPAIAEYTGTAEYKAKKCNNIMAAWQG
jgi:glutathione S-transferase